MVKKELVSLDRWDQERKHQKGDAGFGAPKLNGIACPICEEELLDSKPNITLASYPARKNIHCQSCGYIGYRIA